MTWFNSNFIKWINWICILQLFACLGLGSSWSLSQILTTKSDSQLSNWDEQRRRWQRWWMMNWWWRWPVKMKTARAERNRRELERLGVIGMRRRRGVKWRRMEKVWSLRNWWKIEWSTCIEMHNFRSNNTSNYRGPRKKDAQNNISEPTKWRKRKLNLYI